MLEDWFDLDGGQWLAFFGISIAILLIVWKFTFVEGIETWQKIVFSMVGVIVTFIFISRDIGVGGR